MKFNVFVYMTTRKLERVKESEAYFFGNIHNEVEIDFKEFYKTDDKILS